uniref:(northern house mosquito) hypothetical protein n=1 Tax=Culex pipiens TaxID=7175 RepID=A0A8D8FRJ9_CULPI
MEVGHLSTGGLGAHLQLPDRTAAPPDATDLSPLAGHYHRLPFVDAEAPDPFGQQGAQLCDRRQLQSDRAASSCRFNNSRLSHYWRWFLVAPSWPEANTLDAFGRYRRDIAAFWNASANFQSAKFANSGILPAWNRQPQRPA